MDLNTVIGAFTLLGLGISVGLLRSMYVTKGEFKEHIEKCNCSLEKKFDEINQSRRDVWEKIDQVHGWMWDMKTNNGKASK